MNSFIRVYIEYVIELYLSLNCINLCASRLGEIEEILSTYLCSVPFLKHTWRKWKKIKILKVVETDHFEGNLNVKYGLNAKNNVYECSSNIQKNKQFNSLP